MKKLICLFALLGFTGVAYAQEEGQTEKKQPEVQKDDESQRDPKAVEILKQADARTKKVSAAKYEAEFTGTGFFMQVIRLPDGVTVTGKALAAGSSAEDDEDAQGGLDKFLLDVKYTLKDSAETNEIIAGGDGDTFFIVDHSSKTVYVDIDPNVIGPRRAFAQSIFMREFLHPTPFTDELNGKKIELKGEALVGDEKCHHVLVEYDTQLEQRADWYFSTRDYLPRKVVRTFNRPDGQKSETKLVITKLKANPDLDDSMFKPIVPEGYTKNTDDFAP